MKIVLDPQIFNSQKYGGISKYYTEIFSCLSSKNSHTIVVPLYSTTNIYFNRSVLFTPQKKVYSLWIRFLYKLRILNKGKKNSRSKIFLKEFLSKQDYDLFIPTYFDTYFIDFIGAKPFVLTVYDMIYELFPEYFLDDKKVIPNKLFLMEKATRIIAVSENTKKDIITIYPHIDASKIDVVYHGSSIKINKLKVSLPENYVLFVGTRALYKNFVFLVNSIAELLQNDPNLYLICAGGGDFEINEKKFIRELGLEKQIIQKHFEEDELGVFYSKAKCFVFPSLYEGFGIPVLEAMTCGCPVVLTNYSSFPEVAGSAGVYYELNNAEDLKNKIKDLIDNESLRQVFSSKGLEQVKKFSWEKAAGECLSVYKKACAIN